MSLRRVIPAAVVAGLMFALAAPAPAQKPFDDPILERMRKDIFFLASPECEGRGIDTKGIDKAADYIAEQFKIAGLKPAMKDGSYFQPFTVTTSAKLSGTPTFSLTGPNDKTRELKTGTEFNAMGFSTTSKADGGLVFVGYGITAPKLKYDDYAGVDAAGKIVVMLRRVPRATEKGEKRFDPSVATAEESPLALLQTKIDNAVAHNAAGVIIVNDTSYAGTNDPLFQFANHARGTDPVAIPVLHVKRAVIESLLPEGPVKSLADIEALIDRDLKPRSFTLTGWKAAANVAVARSQYRPKNIVGILEGSGPLADETVVIGAHYDHIGYGNFGSMAGPAGRGKIHLGADDNASGTTGLMELARRYGSQKDRKGRRLVFIAFSAEESGLLGSMHYCKFPIVPLEKTVAMINLDMVGRVATVTDDWLGIWSDSKHDRLHVYGAGTGSGFANLVQTTAEKVPFKLVVNQSASLGGQGGSDHESFAMKRVPVLFLFSGFHPQYHRPTDEPERINFPGLKKVVDFATGLADHLLVVDPKPDFRVIRVAGKGSPVMKGPRMGLIPDYNEGDDKGMMVQGVSPGGPAEKGGLKDGDVIVEIAGIPVKNVTGYMTAMGTQKAGAAIDVVVLRKGQKMTLKITPE